MEQQSPRRVVLPPRDTSLAREQKAAFALVGITGGLSVLLGMFFLVDHIRSPLDTAYVGPRLLTPAERQQEEIMAQMERDTDNDSLTDYNELYVHRTSPYLKDTDGDGLNDDVEIKQGTDPTCGAGEDCGVVVIADPEQVPEDLPATQEELVARIENLAPDQMRELLIVSGIAEAQLALLSDEEVQALLFASVRELEETGQLQEFFNQLTPTEQN